MLSDRWCARLATRAKTLPTSCMPGHHTHPARSSCLLMIAKTKGAEILVPLRNGVPLVDTDGTSARALGTEDLPRASRENAPSLSFRDPKRRVLAKWARPCRLQLRGTVALQEFFRTVCHRNRTAVSARGARARLHKPFDRPSKAARGQPLGEVLMRSCERPYGTPPLPTPPASCILKGTNHHG